MSIKVETTAQFSRPFLCKGYYIVDKGMAMGRIIKGKLLYVMIPLDMVPTFQKKGQTKDSQSSSFITLQTL